MNKLKILTIATLTLLSSCSFNNKKDEKIIENNVFKINDMEMNIIKNGEGEFKLYFLKDDEKFFFDWWIKADFNNGLVKNTTIMLPLNIKFGGENKFIAEIKLNNVYYREIDGLIKDWLNTFNIINIKNNFYAVKDLFVDGDIELYAKIPSSIFLKNNDNNIGLCELKTKKYSLKSGICNFSNLENIYLNEGNLIMEIEEKTEYGAVFFEEKMNFPSLKIYDLENILIWNNKYIIFGENYENILKMNKNE